MRSIKAPAIHWARRFAQIASTSFPAISLLRLTTPHTARAFIGCSSINGLQCVDRFCDATHGPDVISTRTSAVARAFAASGQERAGGAGPGSRRARVLSDCIFVSELRAAGHPSAEGRMPRARCDGERRMTACQHHLGAGISTALDGAWGKDGRAGKPPRRLDSGATRNCGR